MIDSHNRLTRTNALTTKARIEEKKMISDYRFSQSSEEKQYAIREIESTLEDAKNNADFVKKQSPAWSDRFECKQCKQSEKGADCCY